VSVCGLWQGVQRLTAVIANDGGILQPPISSPATPENICHLLDYLVTAGVDTLILTERSHTLIAKAQARQLHVRLVPHDLFDGIRIATAIKHRPARHTAVLLARWPFTPALRMLLREVPPTQPRKNQIPLF